MTRGPESVLAWSPLINVSEDGVTVDDAARMDRIVIYSDCSKGYLFEKEFSAYSDNT